MGSAAIIEQEFSYQLSKRIEICSHCGRPFCLHCWNHTNLVSETVDLWQCSNPSCRLEFFLDNLEE
jgi:hypothetical protein